MELDLRKNAPMVTALILIGIVLASVTLYNITLERFNRAQEYAKSKNLSSAIVDKLGLLVLESESRERVLIDYLTGFSEDMQHKIVDSYLADNRVSSDEICQIEFLKGFSQSEQVCCLQNESFADFDWDKDNMNNYFEQNIANLPYSVYNGRYALLADSENPSDFPGITFGMECIADFLVTAHGFLEQNVRKIIGNNDTVENFKKEVTWISGNSDANSIVYIGLSGHGAPGVFCFNDGYGDTKSSLLTYSDINSILNSINSKTMLITIEACDSNSAIEPLKDGNSERVIIDFGPHWFYLASKRYSAYGYSIAPEQIDIDKNGHISVAESIEAATKYQTEAPSVDFADINKIAGTLFFGDFDISSVTASVTSHFQSPLALPSATVNIVLCAGENGPSEYGFGFSRHGLMLPGPKLQCQVGDRVSITVYNVGTVPHSWEIRTEPNSGGQILFNSSIDNGNAILPWQWRSVIFEATQAGQFYYISAIPGDVEKGMWGIINVVDAGQPIEKLALNVPCPTKNANNYTTIIDIVNQGSTTVTIDPNKILYNGKQAAAIGDYAPILGSTAMIKLEPGQYYSLPITFKFGPNGPWNPGNIMSTGQDYFNIIIQTEAGNQFSTQGTIPFV
jgi:hypothetical protein